MSRTRVFAFGAVSVGLIVVVGIGEFVLIHHATDPASGVSVVDFGLKLCLVASFLAFCQLVAELRLAASGIETAIDRSEQRRWVDRSDLENAIAMRLRAGHGGVFVLVALSDIPDAAPARKLRTLLAKEFELRLREAAGDDWLLSRWSRDSFALLLPESALERAEETATALLERGGHHIVVGVRTIEPNMAVGVVPFVPGAFDGPDHVIDAAAAALRDAKRAAGRKRVVHRDAKGVADWDREAIAQKLPRAIYDGDLEVYLQPFVDLQDGKVTGFEALARWRYQGRLLHASEIVSMSRDAGVLVELDMFMVDEAVKLVASWNRRRKTAYRLSVNLDNSHFQSEAGIAFLEQALEAHGLPAELLTVEISKTDHLAPNGAILPALSRLKGLGVRLSIDDFGSGASTLADLRRLSADEIKIDGSLLADFDVSADGRAIVSSVVKLAQRLGIATIVEGVEREAQEALLVQMGCNAAQGFRFGRPRPAIEWLEEVTFGRPDRQMTA